MRKNGTFLVSAVVCCAVLAGVAPALAAEAEAGMSIRPMELYGCEFRDGMGLSDLEKVTASWNAWMDSSGQHDYWAYILVPFFHSAELEYEVLWAGGWPTGVAMAKGLERWVTEGGALAADFDKVVDCDALVNFAVMDLQPPGPPAASGPVTFSNCKVEEGRKTSDALEAVSAWVAYEKEQGVDADHFILFPAFGESSDADYSFKWVSISTWAEFGKSYDQYGNGGGYRKAGELFEGLLDCDSSRVYVSTRVRTMMMPE
jgi:hypothetical protein